MEPGTINLNLDGRIARVDICNPLRHNAMSLAMWRRLGDIVTELNERTDVHLIVLRGEGGRAFVSGADISEFATLRSSDEAVKAYDEAVDRAQTALQDCVHPVIAVIEGYCFGGGIGLALSCDLRYATTTAKFRMPAARLGLGYALRGMQRAVSILGPAQATELFFSARDYSAAEAQESGLVHRALDTEGFDEAVEALIGRVAANAPLSLRAAKLAIRSAAHVEVPAVAADAIARQVELCFRSEDYAEGRQAFAERREPRFAGR
ncbi:enoyl-CoA hydratase [Pseudomonas benzenivorans]|uniref:Enoyl-CoA hydratase/isomerase family protein n=1 Tax=Pseudomonas benzenivorans TaxID=556533 RepID=A0ABY5H2T3_9PSED|nr:enoyl-CoA hydratase [Pseudomonas benzenivorans]UTW06086.1 enoyl-CoA hydratase/isomerase family protein [Pseudomonas benzenivorans]